MVYVIKGKIMPPEKNNAPQSVDSAPHGPSPQTRGQVSRAKVSPVKTAGPQKSARNNVSRKPKAAQGKGKTTKPRAVAPGSIVSGPIALVGLMGVGKTTVGRRLAKELGRPFFDSDDEIEKASGRTVAGYFRDHGEAAFRGGERRVIDRLLDGEDIILATGGGAFIEDETREILNARALTVFLKGDFETIFTRVRKKDTRPLLKVADPRTRFRELYDARYPIYGKAHITVEIAKGPHARTVSRVLKALEAYHKTAQNTSTHSPTGPTS